MKIGIFDPYLDTLGGGEKYMLRIATCLTGKHDVSIFWNLDESMDILKKAEERFGFNLSTIHFTKNIFSSKTPILERLKKSLEYDAIIYLSDGSIPFAFKRNLILHFQFPVEWVNGKTFLTKVKLLFVKNIICNSNYTKLYIDKKFDTKTTLLYPPVDLIESKDIKKENIVLHVGRFGMNKEGVNYKKQDIMIGVFKKMIAGGLKDWRFVLVISVKKQEEDKLKVLKELASGFPIDIVENPTNDNLRLYYQKAKIYWHASGFGENLKKYPEKAEHFGISTVEAMGAGAVPIVINAGGQKEIVENNKNGFLWNTEEELIRKTNQVIKDINLFKKLSFAAKNRAQKFSVDRFCKEINKIIESNFK